ncbi:hypothetical protein PCASD_03906 [Puccinia coronata f. sp. avenae]|uniref:Uncharacterized protein n=1 Tax=Puccinia coronata f. sp. avenae TaxID=200324 RepID=A0A2N5VAQ7_9BASI|nr:hypothetical protein PCASD_03906 [Puccinia coronata f. sp. avenae]
MFIVKTDNNTTLSKILHCKSKDGGVKAKWKIIKNLLLQAGIDLHAQWVTSTDNKADGLSIGKLEQHKMKDLMIAPNLPRQPLQFHGMGGKRIGRRLQRNQDHVQTLAKYLFAIKTWHTFHNALYPYQIETRVKLILKESGKQDALQPPRQEKLPVLVEDLANLAKALLQQNAELKAVKDLAIVAFWGMARMS